MIPDDATSAERVRFPSIFDEPLVRFGREVCGDLAAGFRREWLVTNGIGGYASGTLLGVSSRSYHGLLVAALQPPVARTVLVGGSVEWVICDGRRFQISTSEYGEGVFDPEGYRRIEEFHLEGTLPVWTYALAGGLLERRVWMTHGKNTTYVSFRHVRGSAPMDLEITPLVTYRDFHTLTSGQGWQMQVERQPNGAIDEAFSGATPLRMLADGGEFRPGGRWYWNFRYRDETARGLNDHGDLYAAGMFSARLEPGQTFTIAYTAEEDADLDGARTLAAELRRQRGLLETADAVGGDPMLQQLVLAADQFIVDRARSADAPDAHGEDSGKTIVAGYHWFNDWGRDTMIALPGLTLATGRAADAVGILRTYAAYLDDGLLPNNFPDHNGVLPGYNTADATLWYVLAVRAHHATTGDDKLLADLLPSLLEIVEHHIAGTRYGIAVDPRDGLLRAGEAGMQLTWMDAKVGDLVVTPRIGKPVEINALWYNALRFVADAVAVDDAKASARYGALAERMRAGFLARFVDPKRGHLADVVDGPEGDDWSLRPNQLLALSLPHPLVEGETARRVLETVSGALLTTYGLRTLNADNPAYVGHYLGDQISRDRAYHQGTVWAWLLGAYVEAYARVTGDRTAARAFLRPIVNHLRDAGLGSVSEIFEGNPPHPPRGAIAQAWSVAEILRVWRELDREPTIPG